MSAPVRRSDHSIRFLPDCPLSDPTTVGSVNLRPQLPDFFF
ncbi:hypothetical protein [Rhodococcus sp. W8901]|nr:hypothetical protein [Rhodococcus sp. W8901]